jgi:hypothetical protein
MQHELRGFYITMSKINDTSRAAAFDDHRPLADSELEAVSGGVTVKQKVVEHD